MGKVQKKVTMREIARKMNVSAVTVSKALAGKEGVGDELRAAIIKCAEEMEYKYSSGGDKGTEKVNNIGILVADRYFSDNTFYFSLYKALLNKANEKGFSGILEIITDYDEKNCVQPQIIKNGKADGIIFLGEFSLPYIDKVVKSGFPFVFLDFYYESYPADSVVSDNLYGSYMLTNKLIETGHKDIAFVGTVQATSSIFDRYLGYHKSLMRNGIPTRSEWIIDDRGEDGIIFESIKLPEKMPTAFVCNCDETAFVLINTLNNAGYRVPEDISVVGFDDYIYATMSSPQLTTFRVNMMAMGEATIALLIRKIRRKPCTTGRTIISGMLVMRGSIKPIEAL